MVGSQVRALVSPPPSPWVETFVSLLGFIAGEWGLFALGMSLCGRSPVGRRPRLRVCLRIKNFRSPLESRPKGTGLRPRVRQNPKRERPGAKCLASKPDAIGLLIRTIRGAGEDQSQLKLPRHPDPPGLTLQRGFVLSYAISMWQKRARYGLSAPRQWGSRVRAYV
jgi:hypothetical protein